MYDKGVPYPHKYFKGEERELGGEGEAQTPARFPGMVTIYITEAEDGKRKVRTSTLQSLLVIVLYLPH